MEQLRESSRLAARVRELGPAEIQSFILAKLPLLLLANLGEAPRIRHGLGLVGKAPAPVSRYALNPGFALPARIPRPSQYWKIDEKILLGNTIAFF